MNDDLISNELEQIRRNLKTSTVTLPIGKMIRSKISLLILKALGEQINEQHLIFLTSIELIHNASLMHDDVLDNDKIRRKELSKNELLGNKSAILLGNLVLTNAVTYLLKTKSLHLLSLVNNTIKDMCYGELKQKEQEFKIPNIDDYISKTYLKTGTLFVCAIKGILNISGIKNDNLTEFAKNFGILFQIKNDIENIHKDKTNGIYTAPIIYANSLNFNNNAIEKTISLVDNYTRNAVKALSFLGESDCKSSLIGVVECLKISKKNIINLEKNTQI